MIDTAALSQMIYAGFLTSILAICREQTPAGMKYYITSDIVNINPEYYPCVLR